MRRGAQSLKLSSSASDTEKCSKKVHMPALKQVRFRKSRSRFASQTGAAVAQSRKSLKSMARGAGAELR